MTHNRIPPSRRALLGASAAAPLAAISIAAMAGGGSGPTAAAPSGSVLEMAQRINVITRRWNAPDTPGCETAASQAEQEGSRSTATN